MGIRDKPIAPASPWQNGFAERLVGSIRRERLDHIIISSEAHLRRIRISCAAHYNGTRTRLSLNKDAPISRAAEAAGRILCLRSLTIDSVNSPLMDSRWLPALGALDFICVAAFQMQSADMSEV
jgi:transposase InsO family protein